MVLDFKDLKTAMVSVLEPLDHAFVLAPDDPLLGYAEAFSGGIQDLLVASNGKTPRLFIWQGNPTAESFAEYAAHAIQVQLPKGIAVTHVKVWETANSFAEYRVPVQLHLDLEA